MVKKQRIDQALVSKGLARDIDEANRLVMAGKVQYLGQMVFQSSQQISAVEGITIIPEQKFVSRGGDKLQAAFDRFPIDVKGMVCADIGSSSGGFTDCLLQHGAERVYAIDVGYGILEWKLRNDPRVEVMERTNARNLDKLPEAVNFFTADVSFISLKKILPPAAGWFSKDGGQAVVLIKPQFEATREEAARGEGVISNPVIHERIVKDMLDFAADIGFAPSGLIRSPLQGPAGNVEFLAWLIYPGNKVAKREFGKMISYIFNRESGS
jgi:23S rRNA (cytidine1920-2'-O)/16S rRNA (cytidine1409-2'-O)-methyltransferase